jgi:hypothetical protein
MAEKGKKLLCYSLLLVLTDVVNGFTFKYNDGSYTSKDVSIKFICPVIDAEYQGKTIPILGDVQATFKATTCFELSEADAKLISSHTLIAKGNVMAKPTLYDSVRGMGLNVNTNIYNIMGQVVLMIQGAKYDIDQIKLTITNNGNDITWYKFSEYLTKNMCTNFVKRMTMVAVDKDFDKMKKLSDEINTCTSKTFWDRLSDSLKSSKDALFSKCTELAMNLLKLTGSNGKLIVDSLNAIKSGIEVIEEMIPESDSTKKAVLTVFQQYKFPLEVYLKYGQENNKFAKLESNPKGKNSG